MRVLSITTLFPNPSRPRFGIFIANRLNKLVHYKDINIRVIAPIPWFPLAGMTQTYSYLNDIPLTSKWQQLNVDYPRFLSVPGSGFGLKPRMIASSVLSQIGRNEEYDLIDAHYAYPDGAAAAIVAKKLKIPMVLSVRGSDINELPKTPAIKKAIQNTLAHSKHIISVSHPLSKKVSELHSQSEISVIENGVDQDVFYYNKGITTQENLLLSVGNLISLKGHDLIISAVAANPNLELVIIGTGPERENLERIIQKKNLSQRVRLIGNMNQVALAEWYNKAAVTLLASSNEGCPNVVLESIACGTPVLATRVGACEELINEENSGLFIEERSVEGVALAIQKFTQHSFVKEQVTTYSKKFNWQSVCDRQFHVYENVLNNRH